MKRGGNLRAIRAGFEPAVLFALAGLAFGDSASEQKIATVFWCASLLAVLPLCHGRRWSPEFSP